MFIAPVSPECGMTGSKCVYLSTSFELASSHLLRIKCNGNEVVIDPTSGLAIGDLLEIYDLI